MKLLLPLLLVAQSGADISLPATLVSPSCVACRIDVQGLYRMYSAHDWAALTRGEILTNKSKHATNDSNVHSQIQAAAIIDSAPIKVWDVLLDFEARSDFIPGAKKVRVVQVDGNRVWVSEHLRVLLMNIRYQVIGTIEPEIGRISWVLDTAAHHDIADTSGSWQIAPLADGARTLVQYRASIDTGKPVPRFIEDFLTIRSLPKVVGGLRTEVLRRLDR